MNEELSDAQLARVRDEYILVRDDDRYGSTVVVSYLTGLVAVHAAIFAVYAQDSYREDLHDGFKGLIPLVSFGLAGMFLHRAANEIVRSHYLRSLESVLYGAEGVRILDVDGEGTVPVPGLANIAHEVQKPRTRNYALAALAAAGVAVFFGVVLATSLYALVMMDSNNTRVFFGVIYFTMFGIICRVGWSTGYSGHAMWRSAVESADRRLNQWPSGGRSFRLAKYCALPRPFEILSKGALMGICGTVGGVLVVISEGRPVPEMWPILAGYVAFELLLYQARYMANDTVGMFGDSSHPSAPERRRIPLTGDRDRDKARRNVVLLAAIMRSALYVACVLLLPSPIAGRLAWAAGVLVVSSTIYDLMRVPFQSGAPRARKWQVLIGPYVTLGTIGAGYAIRGTLAVVLVAGVVPRVMWLGAFLYLAGTAGVWMSWAINSFDFIPKGSSLPAPVVDRRILQSPHIHVLGEHAGFIMKCADSTAQMSNGELLSRSQSPYLIERTAFGSVWDLTAIGSGCAAVVYGLGFANAGGPVSIVALCGFVASGLAGVALSLWRHPVARWVGVPVVMGSSAILMAGGVSWRHAVAAGYPVVLAAGMAAAYLGLTPRVAKTDIMLVLEPAHRALEGMEGVLKAGWRELSESSKDG